jgi:hypothetical protein
VKKLFGAIILATMVAGVVFVSASSLPVVGGTIQAGNVANVSCQTNPLTVSYKTQLNGSGVNEVTDVVLSGVDQACQGKSADIALITSALPYGSGVTAYNIWGTLDGDSSTTFHLGLGGSGTPGDSGMPLPLSSAITGVHVQIKN